MVYGSGARRAREVKQMPVNDILAAAGPVAAAGAALRRGLVWLRAKV
jgi:hypothetical protein